MTLRRSQYHHHALIPLLILAILVLSLLAVTLAGLSTRPWTSPPATIKRLFYNSATANSLRHHHDHGLRARQLAMDPPSDGLPAPGPINATNIGHGPGGPLLDGPYTYYCGVFNTGMPATIRAGAMSLRAINMTYSLPPGACQRVYCYDTTAVYVCNSNSDDGLAPNVTMTGYGVGWMADRLSLLCCDSHHAASAQLFHPTAGWNTVVGYGNCRHDPAEPPSSFGTSNGGVNGFCIPSESRPSPGTGSGAET
ncbi:uncharacterized protein SPSK_07918 [Sporothrix schenckii 1099-18]|uniref:Uncharacterized protein n=1 Tax=Sporothrix schenckii 1099-18 TaxID=1397361 RepID=A0A0F2MES0_SPOSC|nr:uncharacterized protein SPSK_07918 [Sporothrix schenckii 1099-18]KJR88183.1 hypothetical protein SPSK_07918 [Sporothrix schenckii 1099-18]